jgi:hypothetical protein
MGIAFASSMSWFSILPVVATLLAEAPASVAPANPVVVVPSGALQPVAAPTASAVPRPIPPAGPVTRWYGAPAVAADLTELVLLGGVIKNAYDWGQETHAAFQNAPGAKTAAELLLFSTLFSGAVVHGLHRHAGRAAGSIALRAGALLASGLGVYLIASSVASDGGGGQPGPGLFIIGLVPLPLVAMAIDDAVLARDRVPAAAPAQAAWTPTLQIKSGLALLGLRGSF